MNSFNRQRRSAIAYLNLSKAFKNNNQFFQTKKQAGIPRDYQQSELAVFVIHSGLFFKAFHSLYAVNRAKPHEQLWAKQNFV